MYLDITLEWCIWGLQIYFKYIVEDAHGLNTFIAIENHKSNTLNNVSCSVLCYAEEPIMPIKNWWLLLSGC
jgi:hypothetical protein